MDRIDSIAVELKAFHEQHRTPLTGSCWCCCISACDPDSEDLPDEILALQAEYWRLMDEAGE
jgi:hypothetical protein